MCKIYHKVIISANIPFDSIAPKGKKGEFRMMETPAEEQFPARSAASYWFQMVYYSLLHLSYILLTTAVSF